MNKNVTLAVDERTLKAARAYARQHDTTLNHLFREWLERTVMKDQAAGVDELLRFMDEHSGHSGGWKWNREEIYEERLGRYNRR